MRFLYNNFYFGRNLPAVVIALDAPTFGIYERQLLRKIFPPELPRTDPSRRLHFHHNDPSERNQTFPRESSESIARPVLICADAAYKKVSQYCGIPEHHIDFVVGDLDSLKPEPHQINSIVDTVSDFDIPTTSDQIDQIHESTNGKLPYVIKVRDQDTTDFEKCLQFCTGLFRKEARHRCESNETPLNSNIVLTIGAQGGEWHHEASILHTAAKYSRHLHLRIHSANSTIMFCAPFGKTVFRRNREFESDVFAVVPLGLAPRRIKTTGLKWDLDVDAKINQGTYFGWTNRRKVDVRNYMLGHDQSLISKTNFDYDHKEKVSGTVEDNFKKSTAYDPYDELSHKEIYRQQQQREDLLLQKQQKQQQSLGVNNNDQFQSSLDDQQEDFSPRSPLPASSSPAASSHSLLDTDTSKMYVRSYISTSNAFAKTSNESEDNVVEIDLFDPPKADGDLYVVALTVNNRRGYVEDLIESTVQVEAAPKHITRTISQGQDIEDRFQSRRLKLLGKKAAVNVPKLLVSAIVVMNEHNPNYPQVEGAGKSPKRRRNPKSGTAKKNKYLVIMDNGAVWSMPYQRLQFGEKTLESAKKLVEEIFFPPQPQENDKNTANDNNSIHDSTTVNGEKTKLQAVDSLLDFETESIRTWALLPKKERDFHLVVIEHAAILKPNWRRIEHDQNFGSAADTAFMRDDDGDGVPDVFQQTFDGKSAGFFTKDQLLQLQKEGKTDKYVIESIEQYENKRKHTLEPQTVSEYISSKL